MAIIWRLSWPELLLLFVGVWLCLALEKPNAATHLPSDCLAFPLESQPKLESRLTEIDWEIAEVSRLMNVALLIMQQEAKKDRTNTRISTGSEKSPATTTGKGKEEITNPTGEQNNTTTPRNRTHPASESFGSDPESNSQRPWEETEIIPTTIKTKVVLEARLLLETSRKCPKNYTLSTVHCRRNA